MECCVLLSQRPERPWSQPGDPAQATRWWVASCLQMEGGAQLGSAPRRALQLGGSPEVTDLEQGL